jgi:hypothetical protein
VVRVGLAERAEKIYGVVFSDDGEIDLQATTTLRRRMAVDAGPRQDRQAMLLAPDEILARVREEAKDIPYQRAKDRWW